MNVLSVVKTCRRPRGQGGLVKAVFSADKVFIHDMFLTINIFVNNLVK